MKTYGTEPGAPTPETVGISEFAICENGETLKSYGLGSCLAIAVYDPDETLGGLAHAMLPVGDGVSESEHNPGKYVDTAIRTLLRRLIERGASYITLEAKLAGGSDIFSFQNDGQNVGTRNVDAAKRELENLGVPVVAEDVGGDHGRTVSLRGDSGKLVVTTASDTGRSERIL